jgi:hypothetical protein
MPSHVIADLLTLNTVLHVYSTVYSIHAHTLSLSGAQPLLFDLVSNNPSLIQIYDSFILRSISPRICHLVTE